MSRWEIEITKHDFLSLPPMYGLKTCLNEKLKFIGHEYFKGMILGETNKSEEDFLAFLLEKYQSIKRYECQKTGNIIFELGGK